MDGSQRLPWGRPGDPDGGTGLSVFFEQRQTRRGEDERRRRRKKKNDTGAQMRIGMMM
jgi:hypothetical protein